MKKRILLTVVAAATIFGANAQSNIYVDVNATGNESGTSWGNAYTHIQDAIDNANSNDTILIKAGTYKQQAIISKSVTIYGGFDGSETSSTQADPIANPVIFDADLNGDDVLYDYLTNKNDNLAYHINIQGNGITTFDVKVEGITFKNAYRTSDTPGSSVFLRAQTYIINAYFKNCTWVQNCNAHATASGGVIGAQSVNAGIHMLYIDKCWFEGNAETGTGGYGSAIHSYAYGTDSYSYLYATNSVFIGNTDVGSNGGNYVIYQAVSSTASASTESNSVIRNNTFYGNYNSKAMLLWNGAAGELNSIFDRNIISGGDSTMVIGNAATAGNAYNVSINNNYLPANSITASVGFGYVNNTLGTTPGFTDAANHDYSLTASSPCLDIDGSLLWMPDNFDYAGNPRFSGIGVDLGAYEYQYQTANPCAITNVTVDNVSACDPQTNDYSVTLTVTYENEPTSGTLNFGGALTSASFPIQTSPQTITVNISDNTIQQPNISVYFSEDQGCEYSIGSAWTAPCQTTGINGVVQSPVLDIYPNPASSVLNIEITESTQVRIVNTLGQTCKRQELKTGNNTITLNNFPSGVYFIQSENGSTARFVKQ